MHKFATKKNREDVIALRWPKACLFCGNDIPDDKDSTYAIVGMFHVEKQTQILVKLPGFFYRCEECTIEITSYIDNPRKKQRSSDKLAKNLLECPWTVFIELGKNGDVRIPDGVFKKKLQLKNPDAQFKSKKCPMSKLRGL